MLQVRDLAVEVGGRLTLVGASFSLHPGDKVGLVGRNGAGKTSMLKVVAGEAPPAAGVILRPEAVGYLPQDPSPRGAGVDSTGLSHVLSGRGLDEAQRRLEKLHLKVAEDPSERNVRHFSNAEDAFRDAGGYAAESEVRRIAAGLGLSEGRLDLPIAAVSGGERRRVELARILFAGSDLLLLDEPTNHLDIDAKEWLMGFLRSYRGALLVVSHDLSLLDHAITRVMHLDEGEVIEYRGTYSQYRVARRADEQRRAKLAVRQEADIRRLASLADSMRHQTAKRARVAKTLDRRVETLREDKVQVGKRERSMSVRLPEPPRSGAVALSASDLSKSYGAHEVFSDVSFDVGRGERLLVLGLNGAGKTTLLRVLMGETEPDTGAFELGHNASLGYYAQEHEGLVPNRTVLEHLRDVSSIGDQLLRSLLGMFGLSGEIAFQDAATLSGGEKTKLALAMLVAGKHNVLLLDEPTNNLDPPSRVAIGTALRGWKGAMVLVSHDTEFVTELAPDRVLVMPEGTLDYWSDDFLDLVALA
ncbi:MAG: putative transporter ATP-binding protein [Actinomycetia bacterium]|nr:putative transporter ATP-binding protein [Actinomycetes bacterium]